MITNTSAASTVGEWIQAIATAADVPPMTLPTTRCQARCVVAPYCGRSTRNAASAAHSPWSRWAIVTTANSTEVIAVARSECPVGSRSEPDRTAQTGRRSDAVPAELNIGQAHIRAANQVCDPRAHPIDRGIDPDDASPEMTNSRNPRIAHFADDGSLPHATAGVDESLQRRVSRGGTQGFPEVSPSAIASSLDRTDSPSARYSTTIAESGSPADRRPEIESTRADAASTKVFVACAVASSPPGPARTRTALSAFRSAIVTADRSGVRSVISSAINAATSRIRRTDSRQETAQSRRGRQRERRDGVRPRRRVRSTPPNCCDAKTPVRNSVAGMVPATNGTIARQSSTPSMR